MELEEWKHLKKDTTNDFGADYLANMNDPTGWGGCKELNFHTDRVKMVFMMFMIV